jgi:hypothetical protein
MGRIVKTVMGNSLTQAFDNLCTYLSTAIVDRFAGPHRHEIDCALNARKIVRAHNSLLLRIVDRDVCHHIPHQQCGSFSNARKCAAPAIALAENPLPIYSYAG